MTAHVHYMQRLAKELIADSVQSNIPVKDIVFPFIKSKDVNIIIQLAQVMIMELASVRAKAIKAGVTYSSVDSDTQQIMKMTTAQIESETLHASFDRDMRRLGELLGTMMLFFEKARPHLTVERHTAQKSDPEKKVDPPKTPPQQINVELQLNLPQDGLPVHVASLPTRTTTSTVTRDDKGNIVASTQVETDS